MNRHRRNEGWVESALLTVCLIGLILTCAFVAARCWDTPNVGEIEATR